MTYVGGTASIEDAARKMFEQLMELLDNMEDVLSEKKQCSLIIDALKPVELQRAVKQRIEEHDVPLVCTTLENSSANGPKDREKEG
jgi:hypothetical protein